MRYAIASLALAGLSAYPAPPVASAEEGGQTELMSRALAAGYKAAFTCSGVFNADQSLQEIDANELTGVYPDYRQVLRALPRADVDSAAKTVSVSYDAAMPARVAAWRPGLGCALLPVGARADAKQWLPGFASWPEQSGRDRSTALGSNVTITADTEVRDRLNIPISLAFDGQTYGAGTKTSAVVVVRGGEVLGERYARGVDAETPQRTWSVAKSITATLIGAAVEQGHLSLDSKVLIEAWSGGGDPRREISLRHLLHMASGLDSGENGARTDRIYFGGARVVDAAATRLVEAPPGARFKYANNDTLLALRAFREALQDDAAYHRFPYESLLTKIGALRTTMETDWNGDFIGSSQVWTTARDLARIGQLYLQDGEWGGERILPEGWVDFVTTPAPGQPEEGTYGYGAQFWLLNRQEGLPADAFAALGHRGQSLIIIPSKDVVIVRRGFDESGGTRFDAPAFAADVLEAIEINRPAQVFDPEGYAVYDKDGNPVYEADKQAELEAELRREMERQGAE